jgi:predicted tellurium resistance membrane protein TerC
MDLPVTINELIAFAQVVAIDVALAGDNAVVVGMAVTGLPDRQKRPVALHMIWDGGHEVVRAL